MLTDSQVQKACLAIAVIGVSGIMLAGAYTGPAKMKIIDISRDSIGQIVEVSGIIESFSSKDGHIFIQLRDGPEKISVVMFERTARFQQGVYNLTEGMNITAEGKVLLYRNELEIQADSITKEDY